jgi:hypothetical protein
LCSSEPHSNFQSVLWPSNSPRVILHQYECMTLKYLLTVPWFPAAASSFISVPRRLHQRYCNHRESHGCFLRPSSRHVHSSTPPMCHGRASMLAVAPSPHLMYVTASDVSLLPSSPPAATTALSLPSLPPACSPPAPRAPSASPPPFLTVWRNFVQIYSNFIQILSGYRPKFSEFCPIR